MGIKFAKSTNVVLILLCLMYAFIYIDRSNIGIAASAIKAEFNLSNTQLGFAFSAFSWAYAFIVWASGYFSDRFGPRLTFFVCGTVFSIATILTGFATGLVSLVFARALLGLAECPCLPAGSRSLVNWVSKARWGFAQGITHSASRLATALTPVIVAALISVSSWRWSFAIVGAVGIVFMAVWYWYFRDNPQDHSSITEEELAILEPAQTLAREIPYFALMRRFLPLMFVYFCYGWTLWVYLTWLPSFFQQSYHFNLKSSALFSTGILLGGVIGDTFGGVVSDYIFKRTGRRLFARSYVVSISFVLAFLSLLPVYFTTDLTSVTIALSLAFFFNEVAIAPMWLVTMDVAPRFSGTAGGLLALAFAVSGILSPTVFGYMVDLTGNWHGPFGVSIGLLMIGAVVAFWMRPDEQFEYTPKSPILAVPVPVSGSR